MTASDPSSPANDEDDPPHNNSKTPEHSALCSALAGFLKGGVNAVLGSEGIETIKHGIEKRLRGGGGVAAGATGHGGGAAAAAGSHPPPPSPGSLSSAIGGLKNLGRIAIPGGLAFETHHFTAHALLHCREGLTKESESPMGAMASHLLHFAAGGAGGLAYGLCRSAFDLSVRPAALLRHALSHGALFGGYDCFRDFVPVALGIGRGQHDGALPGPGLGHAASEPKCIVAVAVSGGFAGISQHLVEHALQKSKLSTITFQRAIRSFPSGAAAFLAYEYAKTYINLGSNSKGH